MLLERFETKQKSSFDRFHFHSYIVLVYSYCEQKALVCTRKFDRNETKRTENWERCDLRSHMFEYFSSKYQKNFLEFKTLFFFLYSLLVHSAMSSETMALFSRSVRKTIIYNDLFAPDNSFIPKAQAQYLVINWHASDGAMAKIRFQGITTKCGIKNYWHWIWYSNL